MTNRCNQACRLCPREGFTRPLGLIDPGRFHRVVEEVAQHDTVLWLHFLGEPLLHPRLADLVADAKAEGVRTVGLSTNATLLRGPIVDELVDAGLDRLDCSLDADDPEEYRMMRGTDDFERATGNVRAFLRRRAELGASSPAVSLQYVRTPVLDRRLPAIVSEWGPLLGEGDFVKTIEASSFGGVVDDGIPPADGTGRGPCAWLFASLMVHQDGTVAMCGTDWDAVAPLGHVDRSSIADIWNGPELARRRAAHLEGRFGDVPLCGGCTDWHLADGHGYRNASGCSDRPGPVAVRLGRR